MNLTFKPKILCLKLVASKYLYDDGEEEDAYNYDWCKAGFVEYTVFSQIIMRFICFVLISKELYPTFICFSGNYHIQDLNRLEQEFLIAIVSWFK